MKHTTGPSLYRVLMILFSGADIHQDAAGAEDRCWGWSVRKHSPFAVAVRLIQERREAYFENKFVRGWRVPESAVLS